MSKIHKGIRPKNQVLPIPTESVTQFHYQENLDDGRVRLWTNRMLKSGCNQEIEEIKRMGGLIYCPHCDEYFSKNQFVESE